MPALFPTMLEKFNGLSTNDQVENLHVINPYTVIPNYWNSLHRIARMDAPECI
jgi:hypothetical protein